MTSLAERQRAKAAELGVSVRTIEGKRARYAAQGLWGLVDQRVTRTFDIAGQADPRLVEVVEQMLDAETGQSTGTRSRLIRRVTARVEELHGPGVVPLSGRTAFYALIDRLSVGRHTFGSPVTRRQLANRPDGVFTPTFAMRPGEQIQIDSTPIDVMVLAEDGVPVRADLTIAVDVATRSICAAVLRPVGKAVDASLVLAKMLVPEPMRPGWPSTLRMSVSRLPYERLVAIDARMREAAARPVIVPDQVVIDHGKVFVSDTFVRACDRLGISVQPARKDTPTDKGVVEATFTAIKTLFAQHYEILSGIERSGATYASVNYDLTTNAISHIIRDSGAAVLVTTPRLAELSATVTATARRIFSTCWWSTAIQPRSRTLIGTVLSGTRRGASDADVTRRRSGRRRMAQLHLGFHGATQIGSVQQL